MNKIFIILVLFLLITLFSIIKNKMSLYSLFLYSRFLLIPFSAFILVRYTFNSINKYKLFKGLIFLGIIQLPIVIIQKIFADTLIKHSSVWIRPVDLDFGTFYLKGDAALGFYLLCLIFIILFNPTIKYYIKNKIFYLFWFCITVSLLNSKLSHIMLLVIIGVNILTNYKLSNILKISSILLLIFVLVTSFGYWKQIQHNIVTAIDKIKFDNAEEVKYNQFMEGGYARKAAVLYYINQDLKILGDGPGKYYNPITGEYKLGNKGNIFTIYSELGIIGLFIFYLILISFYRFFNKKTIKLYNWLFILVPIAYTITSTVVNNFSFMLTYVIFLTFINYNFKCLKYERVR